MNTYENNSLPHPAPVTQTSEKFHLVMDTMIGPSEWWIHGTFPTQQIAEDARDRANRQGIRKYAVARETIVQTFEII